MPALEKAAKNPALAERLLPLGIVQDWVPGERLAETINKEYETVSDLTKRLQPRKP